MEIVLMNHDAIIPTRASKGSAGLDKQYKSKK